MEIDADRFQRLLDSVAEARESAPQFQSLQAAHGRAARARSDLENWKSRGPVGDRRNPLVQANFDQGVAELQARVDVETREVRRIEQRQQEASARLAVRWQRVDDSRAWARQQSPPRTLPGGEQQIQMQGFASLRA